MRLVFIHVPKAGGTTLRSVLDRQYRGGLMEIKRDEISSFAARWGRLAEGERAAIRCLWGHMPFGLHRVIGADAIYTTMVRDPVERVLSHYYYVRGEPAHSLHQAVVAGMTLEDYVTSGATIEVNDDQVRLLSGIDAGWDGVTGEMLRTAKANIDQHFPVVGIAERFDESLLLFKRVLGWPQVLYPRPLNVTTDRPAREAIPRAAMQAIEKHNTLDLALYEYARGRLETALRVHGIGAWNRLQFRTVNRFVQRPLWESARAIRRHTRREAGRIRRRARALFVRAQDLR
jgi:hypothetical protein